MLTYLTLGRMGRFGNQMFQIASTIGIARKNKQDFSFPLWENFEHRERFNSPEDCNIYQHFKHPLPTLVEHPYKSLRIPWGYHKIRVARGHWSLSGYLQSEKYFYKSLDEVRHYFSMDCEPALERNTWAIHYRAGDYGDSTSSHPRLSKEYYRQAMANIPVGATRLLFTDDSVAARAVFSDEVDYVGGDYISQFRLMKKCHSFITANSSYSCMAAILSTAEGKRIFCPHTWFGCHKTQSAADCYPRGAKVL